ncbi:MAG: hypothetical protein EA404_11730 [Spirochaetaceae bacterium]|nr:MAG: hypothetical protein EA404_11730 [Spirochaetaceae bacterium]
MGLLSLILLIFSEPTLAESDAETFADMFAAELLFPIATAQRFYDRLRNISAPGKLILEMQRIATEFVVSPVTVLSQMNRLADRHGVSGWDVDIHPATSNFNKQFADVNRTVFGTEHPSAKTFISIAGQTFNTLFYDMLRVYLRDTGKQSSFVQRVLNINPLDAKSLHQTLVAGETEDPA